MQLLLLLHLLQQVVLLLSTLLELLHFLYPPSQLLQQPVLQLFCFIFLIYTPCCRHSSFSVSFAAAFINYFAVASSSSVISSLLVSCSFSADFFATISPFIESSALRVFSIFFCNFSLLYILCWSSSAFSLLHVLHPPSLTVLSSSSKSLLPPSSSSTTAFSLIFLRFLHPPLILQPSLFSSLFSLLLSSCPTPFVILPPSASLADLLLRGGSYLRVTLLVRSSCRSYVVP